MRRGISRRRAPVLVAIAALVALGCASLREAKTADREQLLVESGFRKLVATTPAQQADLARLPARKLAAVPDAERRYVWADAQGCGCLFVGTQPAYNAFLRKVARELIDNDYADTADPDPVVSQRQEREYEILATNAVVAPDDVSIDWSRWPGAE
jgi:hypothetical protein